MAAGLYLDKVTFSQAVVTFVIVVAAAVLVYSFICKMGRDWNKKHWIGW